MTVFALKLGGRESAACSSSWIALGSSISVPLSYVSGGSVGLPLLESAAFGIAILILDMIDSTKVSGTREVELGFQLSLSLCNYSISW